MTAALRAERRVVVGIAAIGVSGDPDETLVTHALGSCLGVVLFDPVARVAGLLHAMLPAATLVAPQSRPNPAMFVETGVPHLIERCAAAGADPRRLIVKAGGGARMGSSAVDYFKVGDRNMTALRLALWKCGLLLRARDVGGTMSRTLSVRVGDGAVTITGEGGARRL